MLMTPKPSVPKISSNGKNRKITRLGSMLRQLTEPAPSILEPERRRRARLLAALLATQFLLACISTIQLLFSAPKPSDIYLATGATLILAVAYYLSRTEHYNLAALLAVGTLSGAIFIGETFSHASAPLYFLILGVLVGSLFLSWHATALIMTITVIGIWILVVSFSDILLGDAIGSTLAVLFVGGLGIVGIIIRQEDLEEIQSQSISLRQSEDRFQMVSYATNDVVWDWDLLTGQVWRNQGIQRLFGFSEDQIIPAMGWWEAQIHPDEMEKVVRSIHAAIDGGEKFWSTEYRFRRVDESYAHVFDRAYIIHDEKGEKPVRMIGAIMDITARKQAEEVLRQESVHDPLTGMFNRRYMEEMLQREISRAERNHQQISIIMLDIDHFKQINDTLGHAAGDALLHALGLLLLSQVRGTDIACRYGGDEFILILPGATLGIAQQRAEKICLGARELVIESHDGLTTIFSLSIGVAVFPEQGGSRDAIFAAADAALYVAKAAGRNQVAVANTGQADKPA